MDERVIGHAVGDVAEGEDMAVVPWSEWARLKLVEEKARAVHEASLIHDDGWMLVRADELAELGAAFDGHRSDI